MKNLILLLTVIFINSFINIKAQGSIKNWVIDKTAIHSPSSYSLLQLYGDLPQKLVISRQGSTISTTKSTDAFAYLELESKEKALKSMSTDIHEIGHAYGGMIHYKELMDCNCDRTVNFEDIQQGFYQSINEQFWIDIKKSYIFPSKELVSFIPANMYTFRFKTYINGTSSTQNDGVIGLLDEMNAYYLGSRFNYEMYPVYKEVYPSDYLNEWVSNTMSTMTAFFEFDFFIKEYLLYAKRYRPETYSYLKSNVNFKAAYQKISQKFKVLTSQYEQMVNREKAYIKFYHESIFWKSDYLRLQERLGSGIYQIIENDFL
jgi:hypothetical protein